MITLMLMLNVIRDESGGDTGGATVGLREPPAEPCRRYQWRSDLTAGTGVLTATLPGTAATQTSARPRPRQPAPAGRERDLRHTILPSTRLGCLAHDGITDHCLVTFCTVILHSTPL